MKRAFWCIFLALGLGPLGCDDDSEGYTPPTGADNGARCIISPAGAAGCSGGQCLGLEGAQIGICSQVCSDTCSFGGVCIDLPDDEGPGKWCIQPCESGADCTDGFECQPIDGAVQCDEGGCGVPDVNAFCVPFRG